MTHITLERLRDSAKRGLQLGGRYSNRYAYGEIWFWGALLLGYLDGKFGGMDREYPVRKGRIDLRQGGSNPVLIEVAVCKRKDEKTLEPGQNLPELGKLTREGQTQAKLRCLLLLDASDATPIAKDELKERYGHYDAGRGKFGRNPVSILYVHKDDDYRFVWRPRRSRKSEFWQ